MSVRSAKGHTLWISQPPRLPVSPPPSAGESGGKIITFDISFVYSMKTSWVEEWPCSLGVEQLEKPQASNR